MSLNVFRRVLQGATVASLIAGRVGLFGENKPLVFQETKEVSYLSLGCTNLFFFTVLNYWTYYSGKDVPPRFETTQFYFRPVLVTHIFQDGSKNIV